MHLDFNATVEKITSPSPDITKYIFKVSLNLSIFETLISNAFSGILRPAGKGARCILVGMGSENGWVEGSVNVWKHTKKDGVKSEDYHNDIGNVQL